LAVRIKSAVTGAGVTPAVRHDEAQILPSEILPCYIDAEITPGTITTCAPSVLPTWALLTCGGLKHPQACLFGSTVICRLKMEWRTRAEYPVHQKLKTNCPFASTLRWATPTQRVRRSTRKRFFRFCRVQGFTGVDDVQQHGRCFHLRILQSPRSFSCCYVLHLNCAQI